MPWCEEKFCVLSWEDKDLVHFYKWTSDNYLWFVQKMNIDKLICEIKDHHIPDVCTEMHVAVSVYINKMLFLDFNLN